MEITVSQEQGRVPVTVFRIKGPVTDNLAIEQRAQEAYDGGARHLLIDLSDVPYMATAGLRALHAEYPFELRNAGTDWVRGAFRGKLSDLSGVARRVSALCPRVLAEDFGGNTAEMERRIGRSGIFICRWR